MSFDESHTITVALERAPRSRPGTARTTPRRPDKPASRLPREGTIDPFTPLTRSPPMRALLTLTLTSLRSAQLATADPDVVLGPVATDAGSVATAATVRKRSPRAGVVRSRTRARRRVRDRPGLHRRGRGRARCPACAGRDGHRLGQAHEDRRDAGRRLRQARDRDAGPLDRREQARSRARTCRERSSSPTRDPIGPRRSSRRGTSTSTSASSHRPSRSTRPPTGSSRSRRSSSTSRSATASSASTRKRSRCTRTT